MSLLQRMHFLQDVFQMTAIVLVSVINIIILMGCIYFEVPCNGTSYKYQIGILETIRQWSGKPGFNPRSSHTKDSKNGT